MKISEVAALLEEIAPSAYAETWDNVGLLVGDADGACRKILLCIDLTAEVLEEARRLKATLIVAYHPVIFKPIARVTAQATPVIYEALRAGVAIYSVHTAFDSATGGANDALADALGMGARRRPLESRCEEGSFKLAVYMPQGDVAAVSAAAFGAGAGKIGNYSECAFRYSGTGTFKGGQGTHPSVGQSLRHEEVAEVCWETVCPRHLLALVLSAIRSAHSYEEPAIDVVPLAAAPADVGLGRVGELEKPATLGAMIKRIAKVCSVKHVSLARPRGVTDNKQIRKLAVGVGSCGDLYGRAAAMKADLYVTGELRHHNALAAVAAGLTVACVGHSNSERLTLKALAKSLKKAAPRLEIVQAREDRDPFEIV